MTNIKKGFIYIHLLIICFEIGFIMTLFLLNAPWFAWVLVMLVMLALHSVLYVGYVRMKIDYENNENKAIILQNQLDNERLLKHELQMSDNETKLAIYTHMDQGFILIDDKMKIAFMNPKAIKTIPAAHDVDDLYYNVIRSLELKEIVKHALEKQKKYETFITIGPKYLLASVVPLKGKNLSCFILINDLTETRLLEQTKRDFFSHASHELKTPITILKGYGELIMHDMLDKDGLTEVAGQIIKQSDLMALFVEDMLTLSHLESLEERKYDVIDASEVLNDVMAQLKPLAEERRLEVLVNFKEVFYPAEYMDFYKLFKNLIENAIKYNKDQGVLKIDLYMENEHLIFEVYDEGYGIPKADQNRIFERFYRVNDLRDLPGTGLGLAIVKHIVSHYKGHIDVDSVENEYTKIKITL